MKRENTITIMKTAAPAAATTMIIMITMITASAEIMITIIANAVTTIIMHAMMTKSPLSYSSPTDRLTRPDRPFDPARLDNYMRTLTQVYGPDMLRYKGVLYMTGTDRKMIFQGVHMLMAADLGNPWGDTKPSTKMVFIGRRLPKKAIMQGLETCLA